MYSITFRVGVMLP